MNKNIPKWVIITCLILYTIFYILLSIDLYQVIKPILVKEQAFITTLLLVWVLTIAEPIILLFNEPRQLQSFGERHSILLPPVISGLIFVLVHAPQIIHYVLHYL